MQSAWGFFNIIFWNNHTKGLFGWYKPNFDFSELIWDSRYIPTMALKRYQWCPLFSVFTWRHGTHAGVQNISEKMFCWILGIWTCYYAKLEWHFAIVLGFRVRAPKWRVTTWVIPENYKTSFPESLRFLPPGAREARWSRPTKSYCFASSQEKMQTLGGLLLQVISISIKTLLDILVSCM